VTPAPHNANGAGSVLMQMLSFGICVYGDAQLSDPH
jgi:hypothetical protein